MLTPHIRRQLQAIAARIARAEPISLAERVIIQKHADRHSTVASWLRRAQRLQEQGPPTGELDAFLADLDLGEVGERRPYRPGQDDLGEWFSGAPGWLRRS